MRLVPILWTILKLVEASSSEFVDPNCPDYDLSLICVTKCDEQLLQCTSSCSDSNCLLDCNRAWAICDNSCPCHADCIDGCKGCENPICFCNGDYNAENQEACFNKTSKTLGQCILDCKDDSSCEAACVSSFKSEHSECPCQENCPSGCPCDSYDCDLPEKKAVLALYSGSSTRPSVLIQPEGEYSTQVF